MSKNSILIVAGEASGDHHGADLVREISRKNEQLQFIAMGSSKLKAAGAEIIVDCKELAIMGFVEVFAKLRQLRVAFKKLKQAVRQYQPDIVVLIDYPGFNLRLAKSIKTIRPQTKIIYYISPQLWAWRYNRINIIKRYVDLMTVILPFEVELYSRENVPVKFVGNPVLQQVKTELEPEQRHDYFNMSSNSKIIGLMPGSRKSEIKHILPIILEAAKLIKQQQRDVEFLLPLAPTLNSEDILPYLESLPFTVKITRDLPYDAMSMCDAIIVTSGTATLEIALLQKPMVVVYKGSALSFAIAKRLVRINYIALCNIVAQKHAIKELLQDEVTPSKIAHEVDRLLNDEKHRARIMDELSEIGRKLREEKNAAKLDELVLELLSPAVILTKKGSGA